MLKKDIRSLQRAFVLSSALFLTPCRLVDAIIVCLLSIDKQVSKKGFR
jgi:hypothetical protein